MLRDMLQKTRDKGDKATRRRSEIFSNVIGEERSPDRANAKQRIWGLVLDPSPF